jgi:hypothetical protein
LTNNRASPRFVSLGFATSPLVAWRGEISIEGVALRVEERANRHLAFHIDETTDDEFTLDVLLRVGLPRENHLAITTLLVESKRMINRIRFLAVLPDADE